MHSSTQAEDATQRMVRRVITAAPEERAGDLARRLAGQRFEAVDSVYLLDGSGRLVGVVELAELLAADPQAPLSALAPPRFAAARPGLDQEEAANLALRAGVISMPVVDELGRLCGVVPPRALLETLRREHVEDLHVLAGIRREDAAAEDALSAPPARRVRDRLPWLLVGLAGSVGAAGLVSGFEETLQEHVAVAFFVPTLVYLADAIGTQTEAITVRGLAHHPLPLRAVLGGEIRAGLIIGLVFAVGLFSWISLVYRQVSLAAAVSAAVLLAGGVATSIGVLLPWGLARLGRDPAFGSGPVATILQDVLTLLIYFLAARLILA